MAIIKLLNVFTFSMVENFPVNVLAETVHVDVAKKFIIEDGFESFVGHEAAAKMYSAILGVEVPMNRVSTRLKGGDRAIIGQYMGPRLPEGKVLSLEEMQAAPMKWLHVEVSHPCPYCGSPDPTSEVPRACGPCEDDLCREDYDDLAVQAAEAKADEES